MEPEIISEKKKKTGRETETLFRVTYRNQNNLIQIADNKANIVISINAMIISSIIAITGYGAVADKLDLYKSNIIIPLSVIVLSCLTSAMFAMQAAKPKLIKASKNPNKEEKSSLLFFGIIANHTQKEYLDKMQELLKSRKDIHEHMTIDIYNQGLVLKRKYKLLSYAYQIFMFGFASSVIVFLIFIAL
ncbi:MAG: DUF5706 domain-containing protein [Cyclobacteriaceae bacterium]|jgi:hypothetical protein|nr:DUF5706 domain-containing protein [Cyclobacteriaceae bacterium]